MNRPLKRSPGEPIGGNMSPADRQRALVALDMQDQLNMLNRRLEVMAGQVLVTGMATISGDKYPTVVVNFGRDPNNSVTPAEVVERSRFAAARRSRRLGARCICNRRAPRCTTSS